ncbi:hypothetical protein UFOVP1217_112 [uncultured Caudovirales phage]|uniref:DUF6321 domain-containing protein n=1 Tax=uncultured Caudovirales phage TaxID=2100421 RepID=A0A6J5NBI9_9CAUD|nr:hypothetical protein UFOVP465_2 [uncultured Caudovirales phage]CAB4156223.1 hypothetical protein UFOVP666_48 [uncultured Caudovirales phage]CAB4160310.1 hypothetical protein UFOVP727_125 [uncultured Caudovirales phage]CAB4164721.1 hypothetical protein UFOVP819_76 [uncultured Caudovirales phage]CAB4171720.1 hypothetical protein UFOVP926_11 [uncultured Caudovirales phage]
MKFTDLITSHPISVRVKAEGKCPPATQDIGINIKNRQKAIDTAAYGPLNPNEPNAEFWKKKADRWDVTIESAKKQRCGNCILFVRSPRVLNCIESALGNEEGNTAMDIVEAGKIGYCEAFDFKCHSQRTCDAWVVGGPTVTDGKEKSAEQPLKDPKGGLTAAGRAHFNRVDGSNLKPGVKGRADTPEKMRRKGSFLTRFFTNPSGPMKDEKGEPTRLALSAAAWGEPVPQNSDDARMLAAKGKQMLERYKKSKTKD